MAPRVKLGSQGLEVSKQGLGCMGYGPSKSEAEMIQLIQTAVKSGITFIDTADVYGNEELIGKAIQGVRKNVQLATKFALHFDEKGGVTIRGDPDYVRTACENSLKKLGTSYIDLYYQHRVDTTVPIEITIREMKKLVKEGKIKYIGLSEVSASDIRRAHAVHPITAVQIEWSLWSRDVEQEIIPTCRELGIGIVAYSPLGRGFFSGVMAKHLPEGDFRKIFPRFQEENMKRNKIIFQMFSLVAEKKGCTPGQLALAWVQCQGDDVVPIPGTTKVKNLGENVGSLAVKLTKEEMLEIENIISYVKGERYNDMMMSTTWNLASSPALSTYKQAKSRL